MGQFLKEKQKSSKININIIWNIKKKSKHEPNLKWKKFSKLVSIS